MRKVFLDDLPKSKGFGVNSKKEIIDWKNSVGYKVKFIYDDIEGEVEILDYNNKQLLITDMKGKFFNIKINGFKDCKFGNFLGLCTSEFKFEIGQTLKDENRDLILVDREYRVTKNGDNRKWYKYTCNVCSWTEGWIEEWHLRLGKGCSCCNGKTVVEHINSIWARTPWMIDLGVSIEDSKNNLPSSNKKIEVICPNCNKEKSITPNSINQNKTIHCSCSKTNSYPERVVTQLLVGLNIKFKSQLTCKDFEWCEGYRYDFYIPSLDMIIEVHGKQHYENVSMYDFGDIQRRDKIKMDIAKKYIKNYIVIDCRKSNISFIKSSIINSELTKFIDLSDINWEEIDWNVLMLNQKKEICDYWNNKKEWEGVKDLAKIFNCSNSKILECLHKGTELGWCNYDGNLERIKNHSELSGRPKKKVKAYKDGCYLGTYESISYLANNSEKILGEKVTHTVIRTRLDNKNKLYKKPYKNYKFEEV